MEILGIMIIIMMIEDGLEMGMETECRVDNESE